MSTTAAIAVAAIAASTVGSIAATSNRPSVPNVPPATDPTVAAEKEKAAAQLEADAARRRRAARQTAGNQVFTSALGAAGFGGAGTQPTLLGGGR